MNNLVKPTLPHLPKRTGDSKASRPEGISPKRERIIITVSTIILIILIPVCLWLIKSGINVGASSMMKSYSAAYGIEKDLAYQKLYQSAYDRAEQNYHVRNTAAISIGDLEQTAQLEVLRAGDTEFITEDRDDNSGNVTAWLEVSGEGIFVVDLQAAEFIVDNVRQSVFVRLPNPELTNISITDATKRLFADDFWDGDYKEGVNLALKQRNEATLQIQKSLLSNQYIYDNAKEVAKSMITNLVKQFNPDIPDLIVGVEFME